MDSPHSARLMERKKLFKAHGESSQDKRRREALERQKKCRNDRTLQLRQLVEQAAEEEEDGGEREHEEDSASQPPLCGIDAPPSQAQEAQRVEGMEVDVISLQQQQQRLKAEEERFREQLMLPEDLAEVPADLQGGWLAIPCPAGERCLVVSSLGSTRAHARSGTRILKFQTTKEHCVLDCIFSSSSATFYVLDILLWKGYSTLDCDTTFRRYWMQTKLAEETAPACRIRTKYHITPLPGFECDPSSLRVAIQQAAPQLGASHLLLYSKETIYTFGCTPLVCSMPLSAADSMLLPYFSCPSGGASPMAIQPCST